MPFIAFLVSLLFFCFSHLAQAETRVTATGVAFFEPGRELVAKEKALDDAKRAALEKAIGASVTSNSLVENFQLIKDQVLSRSSGYLHDIKILKETTTSVGTYEVTIEAGTELAFLTNDLDRFQELLGWQKNPRVVVSVDPLVKPENAPSAQKAADILSEILKKHSFTVLDPSKKDVLISALRLSIHMESASRASEYQGIQLTLNEVSLGVRVIRASDGEILATASAVSSIPGENSIIIQDQAIRSCLNTAWSDIRKKLVTQWEKELFGERTLSLFIHPVSDLSKAQRITSILSADLPGITNVNLLQFSKGRAEYAVLYRGVAESLINELQLSYFQNRYFHSVVEQTNENTIVLRIK